MRKLILIAAIAMFAAATTGFVIPAAAKDKKAVTSGQKMKIKGVVTRRDADTFTVRSGGSKIRGNDDLSDDVKGSKLRGRCSDVAYWHLASLS
jgi:hypothetical protein